MRAFDRFLSSEIAIKSAPNGSPSDLLSEFEAFRQIRHANLVQVHDWLALPSGAPFYTMEFMAGGDWGSRMGRSQDPEFVRTILTKVIRGLGHLHCHGMVHGDLKPGNVLFGLSGEVKLSDVGMRSVTGEATSSGTPGYAAPEVWQGTVGDFRSDIYSASVMAYEALTGCLPFEGRTIREVVASQLDGWVPSPEARGIQIEGDLARTVMRGLERDPRLRQGSADEFLEGLGVEDRVGEILGGRFVDRSNELSALQEMLLSESPGSPTLAYLTGPEGCGRKSLADEFAHWAALRGYQVLRTLPGASSAEVAEALLSASSPTIISLEFNTLQSERIKTVARYIQSMSVERQHPSRVLILCAADHNPPVVETFEQCLDLRPLPFSDVKACIDGYLGRTSLEGEVLEWISNASGSIPGHIISLLSLLSERGLIRRRAGVWSFVEGEHIRSLERTIRGGQWEEPRWRRLSDLHRRALSLVAQFPEGLSVTAVEHALPELGRGLPELAARGWVRLDDGRWQVTLEAKRTAELHADHDALRSDNARLQAQSPQELTAEQKALLAVFLGSDGMAFDEGRWVAQQALGRGDHAFAIHLGERCLTIAEQLGDGARIESSLLLLASARHQRGEWVEALQLLDDHRITKDLARRTFLQGTVQKAIGEMAKARVSLDLAADLAEQMGDKATLLVSVSEMAELDWRHGDEQARLAAMTKVRDVLSREYGDSEFTEERAGLSYQLGAALIVAGRRDEAEVVLHAGMALKPGDYWAMRLSTALGTAEYYLGRFDEALRCMREAWSRAERGGFDSFKARIMSNRAGISYAVGGFRQAVEYHQTASIWARRTGSRFEFIAACQGAAVNQMLLAEYEGALEHVKEGGVAAGEIGSEYHIVKSIDLEALLEYYVGDWARSQRLTEKAAEENSRIGQSDITPRIDLMRGRLARITGDWDAANRFLRKAEAVLSETRDWEDLPGVQIELGLLSAAKDPLGAVTGILRVARGSKALTVQLYAGIAISEIVVDRVVDDGESWNYLAAILGRADEAGAMEAVWRINFALGEIAARRGDQKGAATRFAQSLRGFRQVADKLSAERRTFYLGTPHARHLLARVA